jgi:cell division protein FtsQ
MTAATLKRPGAKRPQVKSKAKTRIKTKKGPSWLSRMFSTIWSFVPIRAETVERAITVATVMVIAGAICTVAVLAGAPQFVGTEIANAAGRAGFQVKRIEVLGLDRMEAMTVYAIAANQTSMAMPLVDLEKVRTQLMEHGWIKDARITRRWPDTLVVDVLERTPSAIWQNNKKLSLIDGEGVVLERVDPKAMPDLPIVIGPNANAQVADLNELLEQVPALKPVLAGATWVGNRRWDLRFQSGEVLALPEGNDIAAGALKKFAHIDGLERLLGRGFVRFDMRDPSKFVVRVRQTPEKKAEDKADDTNKNSEKKG